MINYELAKQLKEAGFPQNTLWYYFLDHKNEPCTYTEEWYTDIDHEFGLFGEFENTNHIANPTLSELIEACGEDFQTLSRDRISKGNFRVRRYNPSSDEKDQGGSFIEPSEVYYGTTPEEAVANLYLAIHAKKE